MEDNKVVAPATENAEEKKTEAIVKEEPKKEEKTYTRAEVEQIKKAERELIIKEQEEKRTEAEKLAKMDAEEKHKYELEKAEERAKFAESKLNAYELKDTALKIAREKGLETSLIDVIDFTKETADSIKTKIDEIEVIYKKAVETGINSKLKETSPKTVLNDDTQKNKSVSRSSY